MLVISRVIYINLRIALLSPSFQLNFASGEYIIATRVLTWLDGVAAILCSISMLKVPEVKFSELKGIA